MGRWTVRGYANQVRLFLFLLVLFLVMLGAGNFSLLFTARDALARSVRDDGYRAAARLAEELPRDRRALPSGYLATLARRHGLLQLSVLAAEGRILSRSDGAPGGTDPDMPSLSAAEAGGFLSGREAFRLNVPWAGHGRLVVMKPLLADDGSVDVVLKVVLVPDDLAALDRRIRWFAVLQAIGVAAVLTLTFAFIRWLLRPYRQLVRAAAASLPATPSEEDAIQDPHDLVSAFQAVVDKLERHGREVADLWGAAADGGEVLAGPVIRDMPSGLVATDGAGTVTAINPAAARMLGVEQEASVGRPMAAVLDHAPELARLVDDCLRERRVHRRVLVRIGGGAGSHVGASVSPVGRPGGPAQGVLCLFSDLTEIREVEEKVRLRQSLAEVGEISAGIAHEVRNSLAAIQGYARLAGRAAPEEARDHAEAIRKEVASVLGILEDYLRFARPLSLNLELVALAPLAEDVAAAAREDPLAADRTIQVSGEWPQIEADEALLRQALTNLLRNALEAVPPGGRVALCGARLADGGVEIQVHDDGPGPPPGIDEEQLFRPFFTTKRQGTGLGLPLVRKTVVYHDGRIKLDRGPWGGARFTLVLPPHGVPGIGPPPAKGASATGRF